MYNPIGFCVIQVSLYLSRYPCFENPYPMDIHESPVTACFYLADCPPDLIPAFYSVGSKQKNSGFSEKVKKIKKTILDSVKSKKKIQKTSTGLSEKIKKKDNTGFSEKVKKKDNTGFSEK